VSSISYKPVLLAVEFSQSC